VESWKLDVPPEPYEIRYREAKYAFLLIMGGDGDLGGHLHPDFYEMVRAVNEDVAVLALVEYPEPEPVEVEDGFLEPEEGKTARVLEFLPSVTKPAEFLPEINTGDPRPISDFLARALVSFSDQTRIAIGFWGHGHGVFQDFDPEEVVFSRKLRFGPLGQAPELATPITYSMLLDETSGNALTNREARAALSVAFHRAKRTEPVDMLFFDTCMNASIEVFTELRPFARTFVASSLLVPGTGWDYKLWIEETRRQGPETAGEWAYLAVEVFGKTYDPRTRDEDDKEAQMGAFMTSKDCDFVEAFAELVRELKNAGGNGITLAMEAARASEYTVYKENIDIGHLVAILLELTENQAVAKSAELFLGAYRKARVCLSTAPPEREKLTGMSIWCPAQGDVQKVGRYYGALEFERLVGWSNFLACLPTTGSSTSS